MKPSIVTLLRDALSTHVTVAAVDALIERGYDLQRAELAAGLRRRVVVLLEGSTYNANGRRRVRMIEDAAALRRAGDLAVAAIRTGEWQLDVEHGGYVANAYSKRGYGPVEAECAVYVSRPGDGYTVVWRGVCRANNASRVTAARGALVIASPLIEIRATDLRRATAWLRVQEEHASVFRRVPTIRPFDRRIIVVDPRITP